MTDDDVLRMESALGLTLPQDYRHLVLHYPVRFSQGTCDQVLWDDADKLISRNLQLRVERKSLGKSYLPIPSHLFLIGEDGAGWQFFIDLRTHPSMVHIMEFERVDTLHPALADDGEPQDINAWLHVHLLDLKNSGIDISSEAPPDNSLGWGCILTALCFCLIVAIVIAFSIAGIETWMAR